jgi:hypothetical protein
MTSTPHKEKNRNGLRFYGMIKHKLGQLLLPHSILWTVKNAPRFHEFPGLCPSRWRRTQETSTIIYSFKGRSRTMTTTTSKKAPNFAPGGNVFYQGTMTTREMNEAAMAKASHQLWPKMRPKPVPDKSNGRNKP